MNLLVEFWRLLDRSQRRRLLLLQLISVAMALSTVGGIAAVLPFFTVLADPSETTRQPLLQRLHEMLPAAGERAFIIELGIGFIAVMILANAITLVGSLLASRFAYGVGDRFHSALFTEYMSRDYRFHASTNSARLASNVLHECDRITIGLVQSGLILVANAAMIVLIICSIMVVNFRVGSLIILGLGSIYGLVYTLVRGKLMRDGAAQSGMYAERARIVGEAFGAIKEVISSQAQPLFAEKFDRTCHAISKTNISIQAMSQSPKYVLEALTACALVGVALYLSGGRGAAGQWVAQLTFLGLAIYRLLPALSQAFTAVARIRSESPAFLGISEDLGQALRHSRQQAVQAPGDAAQGWPRYGIRLEGVSYRHDPSRPAAIDNLTLSISAGSIVGFMGSNGSGKTTLLDLLGGLLVPDAGRILIDGIELDAGNRAAWMRTVAYLQQKVHVSDATLAENIAWSVPYSRIDQRRLKLAAEAAQLQQCVADLPAGYHERLGENGVRLSGGQRQRLGIARALYRTASVLMLDETTSALDIDAEQDITDLLAARRAGRTIILVAHRLTALRHCDVIHEVADGKITRSGTLQELQGPQPKAPRAKQAVRSAATP